MKGSQKTKHLEQDSIFEFRYIYNFLVTLTAVSIPADPGIKHVYFYSTLYVIS